MISLLLAIIYIAFICLGLPDSLLGSAWPVMQAALGVPLSYAGIVSMIIAGGTVVSSLLSDRITRKLGAGLVTSISVLLTAAALFGFSVSNSFLLICLFAIPYGLGAGAVDAALNNYVALHYSSKHMSWLHCFWGVGAATSPFIMGYYLSGGHGWSSGYRAVSLLQVILTVFLFVSLPLWEKAKPQNSKDLKLEKAKTLPQIIRIRGVLFILFAFFGYCAMETTAGLWASSYLSIHRSVDMEVAAQFASLFYIGITAGRLISGFIADRIGDRNMIRIGLAITIIGVFLVWLPIETSVLALAGLIIIGLGAAPIYPSIIHATPSSFGKENSQAVIGVQMASAYIGSTFMPPVFGLIAEKINISFYPAYLLVLILLVILMTERLNKSIRNAPQASTRI